MLNSENKRIKSIAIFLILVVGIFAINGQLYIHKHVSKEGNIVIHAHPYNKSQDKGACKSHHHATGELAFLTSLESFLPASNLVFVVGVSKVTFRYNVNSEFLKSQLSYSFYQTRAPPFNM